MTEDKPKPVSRAWQPDPWDSAASDRFHTYAIKGGICQFCKANVGTHWAATCSCSGFKKALTAAKVRAYQTAGMIAITGKPPIEAPKASPAQESRPYDPNAHIEPTDTFDIEQEERISPTIEDDGI